MLYFLISILIWLVPLFFVGLVSLGLLAIASTAAQWRPPADPSPHELDVAAQSVGTGAFHVIAFRER